MFKTDLQPETVSHDSLTSPTDGPTPICGPKKADALPDVACSQHDHPRLTIDRAGMERIEVVVQVPDADRHEQVLMVPGTADAFASVDDPESKGIHMSRLYLSLHKHLKESTMTPSLIRRMLSDFVVGHAHISHQSGVSLSFTQPIMRPALLSDNAGWRHYPVRVTGLFDGKQTHLWMSFVVRYSSTCPCSAALSRQLNQKQFEADFANRQNVSTAEVVEWLGSPQGLAGTPHSQRSDAEITVAIDSSHEHFPLLHLINVVEDQLGTAVQSAVKRSDEQEFARLNATNLMFCEDAARQLKQRLNKTPNISDFRVKVIHRESLHPHDAVAEVVKGVPGGLTPQVPSYLP